MGQKILHYQLLSLGHEHGHGKYYINNFLCWDMDTGTRNSILTTSCTGTCVHGHRNSALTMPCTGIYTREKEIVYQPYSRLGGGVNLTPPVVFFT